MPRKVTNFSRLHAMRRDDLADELNRIKNDDAFPYMDFREWLKSSNPIVRPKGRIVRAEVLIKDRQSNRIYDITEIDCVIVSDNQNMFGCRYYSVYNMEKRKLESIPFDSFEIKEYYADE